jgi:competence ComEA-like helix-hairpin-helix protein
LRISEYGFRGLTSRTVRSICKFLNPQNVIGNPKSFRFFSLRQQGVLLALAILILSLLYLRFYDRSSPPSQEGGREIAVEVSGEVRHPGIHFFKNRPTLSEALERAGGFKEIASLDERSSSELLDAGTFITVEKKNRNEIRVTLGQMEAKKLLTLFIPLDLNRVTIEDLCLVPGIGPSLAGEIIAYRERRRAFHSIHELKEVNGIGDKMWKKIVPYVAVKEKESK